MEMPGAMSRVCTWDMESRWRPVGSRQRSARCHTRGTRAHAVMTEESLMQTLVRAVAIPARVWVTVPGTQVQVRHEAGHTSWCRVHEDGSLTFGNPDVAWMTRAARW